MKAPFTTALILLLLVVQTGCSEPPVPPEVQQAITLEQDLWRTGASVYAPDLYADFQAELKVGRDRLALETNRFSWLRDYDAVAEIFRTILARGEQVKMVQIENRRQQTQELVNRSFRVTERLLALRDLAASIKDSRLNTGNLSRVEVLMTEAKGFASADRPALALDRLDKADALLDKTVARVRPILAEFLDKKKIARWQGLVDDAIDKSRRRGGDALIVNKLRRQLYLYSRGELKATYPVGLGFNPIGDKLYAGDRATPEGRYEIIKKVPNSKYYRALLLNYPNDEDRRRFAEAKRRKEIPQNTRIGGLIEIHGGGKNAATLGCIGLDDGRMSELFDRVEVGTPVVIVAALRTDNLVSLALERLQ